MKPYLVDVPVKINIWIRPECQKRQFDILKQARPSILFLISDGGRNAEEWNAIYKNRELFENEIDWDCKVYKVYENVNQGLYTMGRKAAELIWQTVDRCIFLEDDHIPSISFFRYCSELLERYKDDERVDCICGMNHLGVSENVSSDYFFSRQGSIWGLASWKRVYIERGDFGYGDDPYVMKLLKQRTRHNHIFWKRLLNYAKSEYYEGHVAGGEFWHEFSMYAQNRVQIIPKYNLIKNIGATENSAHADMIETLPKGTRCLIDMKTYELNFPLKHPKYLIPDVEYEKRRNRVLGYNYPLVLWYRRVERIIYLILENKLMSRLKRKMLNRNKVEK